VARIKTAVALIVVTGTITVGIFIDALIAPAAAAPSPSGSAQDTVNALAARGYKVIVSKAGDVSQIVVLPGLVL
jgi:hypothetical protein